MPDYVVAAAVIGVGKALEELALDRRLAGSECRADVGLQGSELQIGCERPTDPLSSWRTMDSVGTLPETLPCPEILG